MGSVMVRNSIRSRDLWVQYKETNAIEDRNVIVERYLPLVWKISNKIASTLPDNVFAEDLFGAGVIGLIDAVEKYDPSLNVQFTTYARYRIRGAIYDELRKYDWVPRSVRQKAKDMQNTINTMELEKGDRVSNIEIAAILDITEEEVNKIRGQIDNIPLLSLDGFRDTDENNIGDLIRDESIFANPEKMVEKKRMQDIIYDALLSLKERDRLILTLYYYEELTLKEIGQVLGITESRVCQIHSRSLKKIKEYLAKEYGKIFN